MRVIIAGGGTGGHIFPALAIGHAVMQQDPTSVVLFVGAEGKMEMEKVPQEGFEIVGLPIAGWNRSNLFKNILLPFKLLKSHFKARKIIDQFKPDVVVGVGGYASFPVLFAAQGKAVPTLIQEQNSYAGKSNMMLARNANRICVAYEDMEQFFPKEKIVLTGNPVRKLISQNTKTKADAVAAFDLDPNRKTILVVGGSLGALSINKALVAGAQRLADKYQIIWQTGKNFYQQAIEQVQLPHIHIFEFIRNMDEAFAAADLIVSRAGAMAISELSIVGKPVIFVPYPFAAEDHQTVNAKSLVDKNAAVMIPDAEAGARLVEETLSLIGDDARCHSLAQAMATLGIRDADERILAEMNSICKQKKSAKL